MQPPITPVTMTFEEFEAADSATLRRMANICFTNARGVNLPEATTAWLAESQFYMAEIARRENNADSEKSHRMEWIISELDRLVRAGKNRVVLNLNDVSEMDTTGLGTLLFALAKLRKAGGDLALVNLKPSHIAVLMAARLSAVFDVFKEDQDAINSFFPGREVQRYDLLEYVRTQQEPAKS